MRVPFPAMSSLATALCLLCLALPAAARAGNVLAPWADGRSAPEDLQVSLVTFGPGDDVPSWFGHTALVVEDRRLKEERLYNYGMFDFDKFARFALGRLEFWVGEAPVGPTYRMYAWLDRDVRVQVLNLRPAAAARLARALADNIRPESRDYLYHHYNDNCSTRPRDKIDEAVGGQLRRALDIPGRYTLRDHTRRYAAVSAPMAVLLDFLMNDEIDRPIRKWDEAFLPAELEAQVRAFTYVDETGATVPLLASEQVLYAAKNRAPVAAEPPPLAPWLLGVGTLLGAAAVGLVLAGGTRRPRTRMALGILSAVQGLLFGVPGLVLALLWAVTNHTVTFHNEDLFLANPLTFAALPLGWMLARGSERARAWLPRVWMGLAALGLLGVALKALPAFDQDSWRLVGRMMPATLGMAAGLWLDGRREPALAPAPRV